MFERFKAYKRLRKMDEFAKGSKRIAELLHDEELVKKANELLYLNELVRKEMWYKREMAVSYNLYCIKNGF